MQNGDSVLLELAAAFRDSFKPLNPTEQILSQPMWDLLIEEMQQGARSAASTFSDMLSWIQMHLGHRSPEVRTTCLDSLYLAAGRVPSVLDQVIDATMWAARDPSLKDALLQHLRKLAQSSEVAGRIGQVLARHLLCTLDIRHPEARLLLGALGEETLRGATAHVLWAATPTARSLAGFRDTLTSIGVDGTKLMTALVQDHGVPQAPPTTG
jgi:hypothetical protein